MQSLKDLFLSVTNEPLEEYTQLSASGSNRRYYRLKSRNLSVIGVEGANVDENNAFIYMAAHFRSKGLRVPQVLAVSDDRYNYLQEDLGDTMLFDYIAQGRSSGQFSEWEKDMLRKTMRCLAQIQVIGAQGFDFNAIHSRNLTSVLFSGISTTSSTAF